MVPEKLIKFIICIKKPCAVENFFGHQSKCILATWYSIIYREIDKGREDKTQQKCKKNP